MKGKPRRPQYDIAAIEYELGDSLGVLAKRYGVSRNSIHTALKRRNVVFRDKHCKGVKWKCATS